MKKLIHILFISLFAAFPLFAEEEGGPIADKPQDEQEITLEEVKEAEEVTTSEVSVQEDKDEVEKEEIIS
ncbi:MAG: hypothetical protein K940chlam1_00781 [Candidatus Anoxychlamydiales bacterium]|nr:hypothetical protein [Candidatus Anoxychlamydiales bacterium]NGX35354.1 hypothetical protein [Candidatus Anoxychlamydiales bacterium]